jgi:Fe-S-cluster-containing dehydrogenase component/CRP-like cAMP-binding protein
MDTLHFKIERPGRWDNPFDAEYDEADLDRLLTIAPFSGMKPANFPPKQPLRQLLRNDTRLRRYAKGELIVRSGDYGSSAFMVVRGTVKVALPPGLPDRLLGRRQPQKLGLFRTIAQLWTNSRIPEFRRPEDLRVDLGNAQVGEGSEARVFLQDVPQILGPDKTATIGAGAFFGEIAALSRMPRTATVFADADDTELLEIRWQGLRDLLRFDNAFKAYIDQEYRKKTLENALRAIPLFQHLSESDLQKVMAQTQFGTYGDYEWSGDYKKLAKDGQATPEKEPIVASEGDYPDGVVIVRSGFARLAKKFGAGQRTLNYLGAGRFFGLREIVHNWRNPKATIPFQTSLRVIGYTHTLFIPTSVMESVVLPGAPAHLFPLPFTADELDESEDDPLKEQGGYGSRIGPELMEFLTANRFFNGTATMVINLERCTRCDDCVRACASTHDGNPRFLRHGPTAGGIQVAQACMHCTDPVCMIGCPTGAIHREAAKGNVVINQATCIGCRTCAMQCPYEAIRMVEARDTGGGVVTDQELRPILKATKCDLCVEQHGGPACERACPHDALKRTNLTELGSFARWLER